MTETIAIVDYGSGNLRSVEKAFERAAQDGGMDAKITVTDSPNVIASADRLVLPGVGAFGACMDGLAARAGVLEAMEDVALVKERPFFGVCVGMQLLAETGEEFGVSDGLGWIPGRVVAIDPPSPDIRVPHMGWNRVHLEDTHPVFADLGGAAFYFAHSFQFKTDHEAFVHGTADHGGPLTVAIGRDNIFGVQFHPEKSQRAGLRLIENFLRWRPL
ncbi:MAG: imidazole glycerol phosphate synthase subunit HisH [Pseudomonadota bacterium]